MECIFLNEVVNSLAVLDIGASPREVHVLEDNICPTRRIPPHEVLFDTLANPLDRFRLNLICGSVLHDASIDSLHWYGVSVYFLLNVEVIITHVESSHLLGGQQVLSHRRITPLVFNIRKTRLVTDFKGVHRVSVVARRYCQFDRPYWHWSLFRVVYVAVYRCIVQLLELDPIRFNHRFELAISSDSSSSAILAFHINHDVRSFDARFRTKLVWDVNSLPVLDLDHLKNRWLYSIAVQILL